jgi:hypothetical protein
MIRSRLVVLPIVVLGLFLSCGGKVQTYSGHYVYGAEVETFQPCGSERTYWVRGSIKVLGELRTVHGQLTQEPYEKIYVELRGSIGPRATEGLPADFDGQLMVEAVGAARVAGPQDCGK